MSGLVGTRDPASSRNDSRIDEVSDTARRRCAEELGADVSLHEARVGCKVCIGERFGFGW